MSKTKLMVNDFKVGDRVRKAIDGLIFKGSKGTVKEVDLEQRRVDVEWDNNRIIHTYWDQRQPLSYFLEKIEKETTVEAAKYLTNKYPVGQIQFLKGDVAHYIAQSNRSSGFDHFNKLKDLGFWDARLKDDAVNILGRYINGGNFCADGMKRANEAFGLVEIPPEVQYEDVTVTAYKIYKNPEDYFWNRKGGSKSPIIREEVGGIDAEALLTVSRKVTKTYG